MATWCSLGMHRVCITSSVIGSLALASWRHSAKSQVVFNIQAGSKLCSGTDLCLSELHSPQTEVLKANGLMANNTGMILVPQILPYCPCCGKVSLNSVLSSPCLVAGPRR